MSQNRTIKAILALDYDKRALSGTQKAIDQLNASLDATRKRTLSVTDANKELRASLSELARQDAIDQVGRDMALAGREGRDFNETLRTTTQRLSALGASRAEIDRVTRAFRDAEVAARATAAASADAAVAASSGAGLGSTFQKIGRFGVDLRALPSVMLPGSTVSSDVIGKVLGSVGMGLSEVTVTASQLAKPLALIGVSFAALAIVFSEFNRVISANAQTLNAIIAGQREYYDLLQNGTRQQVIAARDAAAEQLRIARAAIEENNRIRASAEEQFANQAGVQIADFFLAGSASRGIGEFFNFNGLGELETANADLQKEAEAASIAIGRYNSLLNDNATAANDAAEAAANYQNILVAAAVRRSQIEADTLKFLETATVESANARIAAAETELDRLFALNERLAEIGGATAEALILENNARIDEQVVIRETTRLLMEGTVSARETAGKAIFGIFEDISEGIGSAANSLGVLGTAANASLAVFDIQAKITDAEAKTGAAIDAIIAKLADAEAKALADRNEGLADAQAKYNDAREKQELAHRDRLLAINRRADNALQNAIGARDALAFFNAQEQQKTELKEENLANKRRLQEISKALKQQTEQVIKRYNEQVEAARKAANASIAIENEKLRILQQQLNAEINQINAAMQQRLALQSSYWNASISQDVDGANASLNVFAQFWSGIQAQMGATTTATPTYIGGTGGSVGEIPAAYAMGGYPPVGKRVLVGEKGPELAVFTSPTRIYSASQTRAGAGGDGTTINIPISGAGRTRKQVLKDVDMRLNQHLVALGWE